MDFQPNKMASIWLLYNVKNLFSGRVLLPLLSCSLKELERTLSSYDVFITSGYGPALLHKAGLPCTIFSPYASGVEGVSRFYAPRFLFARLLWEYARNIQIKGLKKTRIIAGDGNYTSTIQ